MSLAERGQKRKRAVTDLKRGLILAAAQRVFEREGLEGASLRAIAGEAGYTPAALYFHFDSKEAIYADLLAGSLEALRQAVDTAVAAVTARRPKARLCAAAMAFFEFYAENPRDLDLGFYLFRGGMRPHGLGPRRNRTLNEALEASLQPIVEAAREIGVDETAANLARTDVFAYASGLLLLVHTQRIRLFGASAGDLMQRHVDLLIRELARQAKTAPLRRKAKK